MGIAGVGKIFARNGLRVPFLRSMARGAKQWDWAEHPGRLKRISRRDLLGPDVEVTLSVMPGVFGETPPEDLMVICALARLNAPRQVFEFGTFTGNTTLNLAMNTPEVTKILTLDLSSEERAAMEGARWEKTFGADTVGVRFRNTKYAGRVHQLLMDSRLLRTEAYLGLMDFVFIDACHEYELVKNDSERALQMLAPGGIIVWHDYVRDFPGVCRYLEQLGAERPLRWVEGTSVVYFKDSSPTSRV